MMNRLPAKRPVLLAWAIAWLCCVVSLDLLHNLNHALEEGAAHHTCLVCEFGHQPVSPPAPVHAASPEPPTYAEAVFHDTGTTNLFCRTSPQPLVPRGPPLSFLFAS